MLRKLFTLLLLVTGLAALSQPAQARMFEVESARTAVDAGYACAAQPGVHCARITVPREADKAPQGVGESARPLALLVPTVWLQADRARE
jgi:hypothetical protein